MPWRIEVALKDGVRDARAAQVQRDLREHLGIELTDVKTIDVYTIDAALTEAEVAAAAHGPFCDPVIQRVAVDAPLAADFDILIEVGYRPGVTDNVGRTAKEAIQYQIGRPLAPGEGVYTSVQYLLSGPVDVALAEKIAANGPKSVRVLKKNLNVGVKEGLESALHREAEAQSQDYVGSEFLEGIRAAKEKRKANF